VGEALALRWRDVDLLRATMTVRASKTMRGRWIGETASPSAYGHSWEVELHRDNRMSDHTPEELRTFPAKERWTPEESLATIEQVDGFDCIHGACLPFYVQTRADRVRWANCVRIAAQVFDDAVASPVVQQTARVLFSDRATYTD
jgi:hypothetical protein